MKNEIERERARLDLIMSWSFVVCLNYLACYKWLVLSIVVVDAAVAAASEST